MMIVSLHERVLVPADPTQNRPVKVDPQEYVASVLIAQLMDGLLRHHKESGKNFKSTSRQISAIRALGRFLSAEDDRSLNLAKVDDSITGRITEWNSEWKQRKENSNWPHTALSAVKLATRTYLRYHAIENDQLERWATSPSRGWSSGSQPLDEYSNRERLALRDYCRNLVRAGEEMLEIGRKLLTEGRNPEESTWHELSNLIFYIYHNPHGKIKYNSKVQYPSEFWNAISPYASNSGFLKSHIDGRPMYSLLAPSMIHLTALRVLIHLELDWPPEETRYITRGNVDFSETSVRIVTTKYRAHKTNIRELPTRNSDRLGWNAGDLFRRAQRAMSFAHSLTSSESAFWVGQVIKSKNYSSSPDSPPRWIRPLWVDGRGSLKALVDKGSLDISQPYSFRRLRKTSKSIQALQQKTLTAAAGQDHSVNVFWKHYAHSTTINVLAAQSVLQAQAIVMDRIGPRVVLSTSREALENSSDESIVSAAQETLQETSSESHIAISACTDPYTPPNQRKGDLCLEAPTYCLACSNAVFFQDHLPRLIFYKSFLKERQRELPPVQFHALHGKQLINVENILAGVPTDEMERAQENPVVLDIPITKFWN